MSVTVRNLLEANYDSDVPVCTSYNQDGETCISGCQAERVKDEGKCHWKGQPKGRDKGSGCACYQPLNESEAPTSQTSGVENPDKPLKLKKKKCEEESCDDKMEEKAVSPEAEEFVVKHKDEFKERYGDEWESVLYATANKKFPSK